LASPIVEAIKGGIEEIVELLLDAGIDLTASVLRKMQLIIALTEGRIDIMKLLIIYRADVNGNRDTREFLGWPSLPLCRAIKADRADMVELLLQYGADLYCTAGWGLVKLLL
jgi:ankyrin repeat protein